MSTITGLTFFVPGRPISQGSKTIGYSNRGQAFMREAASKDLKPWRSDIIKVAKFAAGPEWVPLDDAHVELTFYFDKPKTVRRDRPNVKPDGDKIQRAVWDALTAAGIVRDDSCITRWSGEKKYGIPGVRVSIINRKDTLL